MNFFNALLFVIVAFYGKTSTDARLHGSSSLENEEVPNIAIVDSNLEGVVGHQQQQQQQRKVAEDDQTSNNNAGIWENDLMEDYHRQLGSWQNWVCVGSERTSSSLGKCQSKSSAATKKDAINLAKTFCCNNGYPCFKIKSYKTIFGTKDWNYKCCKCEQTYV